MGYNNPLSENPYPNLKDYIDSNPQAILDQLGEPPYASWQIATLNVSLPGYDYLVENNGGHQSLIPYAQYAESVVNSCRQADQTASHALGETGTASEMTSEDPDAALIQLGWAALGIDSSNPDVDTLTNLLDSEVRRLQGQQSLYNAPISEEDYREAASAIGSVNTGDFQNQALVNLIDKLRTEQYLSKTTPPIDEAQIVERQGKWLLAQETFDPNQALSDFYGFFGSEHRFRRQLLEKLYDLLNYTGEMSPMDFLKDREFMESNGFADRLTMSSAPSYYDMYEAWMEDTSLQDLVDYAAETASSVRGDEDDERVFDEDTTETLDWIEAATQGYHSSINLDQIRQILRNWDEDDERRLLELLYKEIDKVPETILGVSIAFVTKAFREYHAFMSERHKFLCDVQQSVYGYEFVRHANFLDYRPYAEAAIDWGGLLWEPLDWVAGIKDLLFHGDPTSLLFAAIPLVTVGAWHALRAFGKTDEAIRLFTQFGDETLQYGERFLGAKSPGSFDDYARGLGILSGQQQRVSQESIESIRHYLSTSPYLDNALDPDPLYGAPSNVFMVQRLEEAYAEGRLITGADLSFYMHELTEPKIIDDLVARNPTMRELTEEYPIKVIAGDYAQNIVDKYLDTPINQLPLELHGQIVYQYAHEATLDTFDVSRYSLYHPDIILSLPGHFSGPYFAFWGLELP